MAQQTTYSFADTVGSIHSGLLEDYSFVGDGIGSITISKQTDRTTHQVAADGSIMISKIPGNNGTVSIECQQSSPLHKWLSKWFQNLWNSPTSEWASTSIYIENKHLGTRHIITGVSPTKEPDVPYQTQGANITWQLLAADISSAHIG